LADRPQPFHRGRRPRRRLGSRSLLRSLAILAAMLGAVAALGCGKSTEDTYKDDFPPISEKVVALGNKVGDSITKAGQSTNQQLAEAFGNYAQELGDLQQQLDDLDPPEDLAADQDKLVSAIGDVQGDLNDIAAAAQQGNPQAARSATRELILDSQQLRDARRALARGVREL
jgi:hypothetical protein